MFKRGLVSNGMSVNMAQAVLGVAPQGYNTLTGAGTTVADALAVTGDLLFFGTVAAGAGTLLPVMEAGDEVIVFNGGANALKVWPSENGVASGAAINTGAGDAAFSVAVGKAVLIKKLSATQYLAFLSA